MVAMVATEKMTVQEIYMDEKLVPSDALKMEGTVARYLIYSALLANDEQAWLYIPD